MNMKVNGLAIRGPVSDDLLVTALKSILLFRSLGLKVAAGFLRNRGVSAEAAVEILLRRRVC